MTSSSSDETADVERVLHKFVERKVLPPKSAWRGCTDEDIGQLTETVGFALPVGYEHFLRRVGRVSNATLFRGSDVFWPEPVELVAGLADLLEENKLPPLSRPAVALIAHQGYIYFWMHEGDAAVWRFSEGSDDGPVEMYPTFAEWLFDLGFEWALIDPRTVK